MSRLRRLLTMPWFVREHRWTRAHLSAYLDGELAPAGAARVDGHVERCRGCRHLLVTLRRTVAGLGALREPSRDDDGVADGVIARLRDEH